MGGIEGASWLGIRMQGLSAEYMFSRLDWELEDKNYKHNWPMISQQLIYHCLLALPHHN